MKNVLRYHTTTSQARVLTALLLTGVLSVGSGMTLIQSALALPLDGNSQISNPVNLRGRTRSLPRQVTNAIFKDISRQQGILPNNLDITEYTQKNWRNGCLELPKSGELCTQALIPGWRVVATDGKQNWVYHSNNNGRSLRLASSTNSNNGGKVQNLPQSVKNAVFKAATKHLGILPTNVDIIQSESQSWSDGCLGLGDINEICSQAIVPGWRVVVGSQEEALVYHVNGTGSVLRLNEGESQIRGKNLPQKVGNAVIEKVSKISGLPRRGISIIKHQRQTWNSYSYCPPDVDCLSTSNQIDGWEVTVSDKVTSWTYWSDDTGTKLQLSAKGLPQKVNSAVLSQVSQASGLPQKDLNLVGYKRQEWNLGCENIPAGALCKPTNISGWEVTLQPYNGGKSWIYLTDSNGSQLKLAQGGISNIPVANVNLPQDITQVVLKDASQWSGLNVNSLKIVKAEKATWTNPCLLTYSPICNRKYQPTPGWIVTVDGGLNPWVYNVSSDKKIVVIDKTPALSANAAKVIKQDIVKRLREKTSLTSLRVTEIKSLDYWVDDCANGSNCNRPQGYFDSQVTVSNGRQNWIYNLVKDGSRFEYAAVASMPKSLIDAVLTDARQRTQAKITLSRKNIISAEKVQWSSLCLGLEGTCGQKIVDGWKVTVAAGRDRLIYHTDDKSTAKLNIAASKINGNVATVDGVKIPSNQLPEALTDGVIFRQISSGGFAGRTYQVVLLKDGRLIQTLEGDANDSERRVFSVSPEEVQKFQKLLARQDNKFQNITYPAPNGAADYITYTLTSGKGTVQYNDISRESLPRSIQVVVKTWNSLNDTVKQQATGN
ncbi:hypothetical protein [Calothrix sp. PCC 6303]|uniref:hypothetical protein n=1 Tax=Calothrix sp. PCC 6303 TaxID=1170562 RepID=UPI0002A02E32|nr:hypothetical protein [Calothrix sp. PCC 6303]AFZ00513.1 hypothetical protein Cal6303_1464 [Calothrix sp. PCC 6303]